MAIHLKSKAADVIDIFFADTYRAYLLSDIEAHKEVRGYQKQLADAAGCRASYLSQVLHSHIHLTPDQAASLCEFWSFNEDRTEYFLTLVHLERSASSAYRAYLNNKLSSLKTRHKKLSTRITSSENLSTKEHHVAYHSNWFMPAIHVLTSISSYQDSDAISARLKIPKMQTLSLLDELVQMGFISAKDNRYKSIVQSIHVGQDSPLNTSNHFQWRHRAMSKIVEKDGKNLHYTAIHALSRVDAEVLREMAMKFIQNTRKVVEPSKGEEAIAICLDMFLV